MAKLREETAAQPAAPACIVKGCTVDDEFYGEECTSKRSVRASAGCIQGVLKRSTDAGAGLPNNILDLLSQNQMA